jgi:hypothetical protein
MANLQAAKDIVRQLAPGIQLATTQDVADELTAQQAKAAAEAQAAAVAQILALEPPLDLDDANRLVEWQERRETGRPVTP